MDESTKELDYLLKNYWCLKEKEPKIYFNIKNNLDYYKDFIQTKLGSRLIVNDRFIKLEKIPAVPKSYMGIADFSTKNEYIILLLVLLFLEDKPRLEQFILSNLIDFINNTATTLKLDNAPDWNIASNRRYLVNVMKHLNELGIINIIEEENSFAEDKKAEALYETTGISNYYVREFKNNILEYKELSDYVNDEFTDQNENLGDVRRYRVYRHILYSLSSYKEDLTEAEQDYIKRFRNNISSEISKVTSSELEITKNMTVLLCESETNGKYDFPNKKAISDIVLLVNNNILKNIENKTLSLDDNEVITIPKEQLYRIIKETKTENLDYLSKYYRELTTDKFLKEVISYMKEYDFLREEGEYKIYPMVSKMVGYILKDDKEQINLFGSDMNE